MSTENIALRGGEYLGLRALEARYGLSNSTARGYVASGRLDAVRAPNRRLFVSVASLEALFQPVQPSTGKAS